jgi:hypothetical protein
MTHMTMTCDQERGCTPVQLAVRHQDEQDRRITAVEASVSGVHRRVDGLLILIITTLASSLAGAIISFINYIGSHAGK